MTAVADQIWGSATEDPVCYICYDNHSDTNPFLSARICECRGSIVLHRTCFTQLSRHSDTCSICKNPYKNPLLAEIAYDPHDPDLAGAFHITYRHEYEYETSLHEFYHVNAAGQKHGICKIYAADDSRLYFQPPWALYEVQNYVHGELHGAYKRYSLLQYQQIQYLECELTYDCGKVSGPFKEHDSQNAGQLLRVGTIHSCQITNPRYVTRMYSECKFIGNYAVYENGTQVVDLCFRKPCGDVLNPEPAALADGTWKIHDETFGVQDGAYHGPWSNDTEHCGYDQGELHGPIHTNAEIGTYNHGKRDGLFKIYQMMGGQRALQKFLHYNNGTLSGECKFFDNAGNLTSVINYEDGLYSGPAIYYDANGHVAQSCSFKQDNLHGLCELYENGLRRTRLVMADGRIEPGSCIILNTPKGALERLVQIGPEGQDIDAMHCLSRFTIFKA